MNPYQDDFYFQNRMMQQNPYQYTPSNQAMSRNTPFRNIAPKMNFQSMLQGTTKTISTINQVVPIVYQVTPIINNARNAFNVIRAVSALSVIDLAEIDDAVIINDETETPTTKEPVEKIPQNEIEVFENML